MYVELVARVFLDLAFLICDLFSENFILVAQCGGLKITRPIFISLMDLSIARDDSSFVASQKYNRL